MVVSGDDALAGRLAAELAEVYRECITLLVPDIHQGRVPGAPFSGRAFSRASALLGRMTSAVTRTTPPADDPSGDDAFEGEVRLQQAAQPDDEALTAARIGSARALALVHEDDETNIHAALRARRINPGLRLVIRLYNRKLGQHLEELLNQAAQLAGLDASADATVTVLSDTDTAAPALAATAVAGTSKVVRADGILLRARERSPQTGTRVAAPALATLALLSATVSNPAGAEGSDLSGDGPSLLPDDAEVAAATGRETIVLEQVGHAKPLPPGRFSGWGAPLGSLFSPRLRWSIAGLAAAVIALTVTAMIVTGEAPLHAAYMTLLDLFAINEPEVEGTTGRQILQLLTGLVGLLLLPVLVAAALEGLGTFRSASVLRRPPRGVSGHVVLLGLGKIGSRVLAQLHEMNIQVVCVEEDPEARGIPLARRLRVPTVIGDVTVEGVLEAAKIQRARALLALTSVDTTNLEAVLYARAIKPNLRVGLRLFDDEFATAVYRTLRAAHPRGLTRSRSVSTLAAPAFASAMMGRQILGAIPVERRVLLFAAVEVEGRPELQDRTVAESFRPGSWRVVALDATSPGDRLPDLSASLSAEAAGDRSSGLVWDLHPGYVLRAEDRVVLAATRQGLGELLGRRRTRRDEGDPAGRRT
ncbi:NAD-binding protein [Streptomyces tsukubensis]|nr:NAD-binding protein [Streptomyces tsukubensis]QFR97506.1 potassium transporter TrkA [Streptomyces tsukubensis]